MCTYDHMFAIIYESKMTPTCEQDYSHMLAFTYDHSYINNIYIILTQNTWSYVSNHISEVTCKFIYDHMFTITCEQSYTNTHVRVCTKIVLIQFYVHVYDHMRAITCEQKMSLICEQESNHMWAVICDHSCTNNI